MNVHPIRQGKCDFADYYGVKHNMVWTVGLAGDRDSKKSLIRKTDIWMLRIALDDNIVIWFEAGHWNRRPPLIGPARDAYRMVLALY